jgi:hypothetical protein
LQSWPERVPGCCVVVGQAHVCGNAVRFLGKPFPVAQLLDEVRPLLSLSAPLAKLA